jgi:hypothetical protein
MFRAQPPFLRPRAIYTRRVVQKAVEAVFCDGLAARCVPDRLARDFWVKPSEKMVRLWSRAFAAEVDFSTDYQPWVVANFSGILCVDEVYRGKLALLLAVDPAAPDGDRLGGLHLVNRGRLARRTAGIAQAHALHQHISSARAIGRQLGVDHGTIRKWLKLTPPDPAVAGDLAAMAQQLPAPEPPPAPKRTWDEVRRVREDLRLHRSLFLHQTENLTAEELRTLAELLDSPVGSELRIARTFMEAWFAIWKDDLGRRRTPDDAQQRYSIWQTDAQAATLAPLRTQQHHLDGDHFTRPSAFLRDPTWEPTNNAAERRGVAAR